MQWLVVLKSGGTQTMISRTPPKLSSVRILSAAVLAFLFLSVHASAQCLSALPSKIKTWSVQLQNISVEKVIRSTDDLIIIDYSSDGGPRKAFTPEAVNKMKCKLDGSSRLLVAYLSIGEAESYRYYWQRAWEKNAPSWLGPKNTSWPDNFRVRYWSSDWQRIIFGQPEAYLDKIIAAGFDGVFLDGIDSFEFWNKSQPDAPEKMVAFVKRLSTYAKGKARCFSVLPLNGTKLLSFKQFRRAITAVVVEDMFYGENNNRQTNDPRQVARTLANLGFATYDNIPIYNLEYLPSGKARDAMAQKAILNGLLPSFGTRELDKLSESVQFGSDAINLLKITPPCAG